MSKLPVETDVKTKIYNLWLEEQEAIKDKKATVKAHNDNIKRIKDEMKEILNDEEDAIKNDQKE